MTAILPVTDESITTIDVSPNPPKLESSSTSSSAEDSKGEIIVRAAEYTWSDTAFEAPPNAGGEGDDAWANEPSVFDDAELAKFYWPRKDYEGIHRFFPDFKWTKAEEKRFISQATLTTD
jgi:hypothetical protein